MTPPTKLSGALIDRPGDVIEATDHPATDVDPSGAIDGPVDAPVDGPVDVRAGTPIDGESRTEPDPAPQHGSSDTTGSADTDPSHAEQVGAAAGQLPEGVMLLELDPRTLLLEANVRTEVKLDRAFVASIKDLGVLVPVTARATADGPLVRAGQRRVRAAIEAGRATVPVYVIDAPDDDTADAVLRIVEQLAENDHREGLSATDRARAHQQLSLLGLSAAKIARRTHTPAAVVKAGLAAADSPLAMGVMDHFGLGLDEALVIAEFEDDPEAVKVLTATARTEPAQFAHVAQRLRDAHTERLARAELTQQLTDAGVTLIGEPGYGERKIRQLDRLRANADASPKAGLSVKAHARCPGHAAYLRDTTRYEPGPAVFEAVYVCTDPDAHGHVARYADTLPTAPAAGPWTEEKKAERREVVQNNKDADSATAVRHRWLKNLLARRTPPKDAQVRIAALLAQHGSLLLGPQHSHTLALQLLGLPAAQTWNRWDNKPHPIAAAAAQAGANRATMLTLAVILGGLEDLMKRDSWRHSTAEQRAYLTVLGDWGYPLSRVEQLITTSGQPSGDNQQDDDQNDDDQNDETENEDRDRSGGAGEAGDEPEEDDGAAAADVGQETQVVPAAEDELSAGDAGGVVPRPDADSGVDVAA